MFFILAQSTDGGKTWTNMLSTKWDNGAEAQARAKSYNAAYSNKRFRVRPMVDTDEDNFVAREQAKGLKFIDTKGLPDYAYLPWWTCAHIDPDNSRHIRYFREQTDAVRCRYTSMLMTRFFASFCGLESYQFEDKLLEYGFYEGKHEFKILRDAEGIEQAYRNGPTSCMNDPDDYPLDGDHPARVYASPDLGLAVLMVGNECCARTVVWPDKKIHTRIYGHSKVLKEELKKLGYRQTSAQSSWRGARLLKIFDTNVDRFVCPYLDMSDTVSEARDGKHLRLAATKGKYGSNECDGYAWQDSEW